ncbi:MAG: hypothetical protein QW343_02445 [Candidatus Norongarragalinales archaeon]
MFGFGLVGDLIAQGKLRFDGKRILLFNNPISFIPLRMVVKTIKSVHESSDPSLLYRACRDETISWLEGMVRDFNLRETDMIDWGLKIEEFSGWGKVVVRDIKPDEKQVVSEILDSAVAIEYQKLFGKAERAVDDVLRGMQAGASSMVHHAEMEAFELSCIAKGDASCTMVVKQRSLFDFNDAEVIRQIGAKR